MDVFKSKIPPATDTGASKASGAIPKVGIDGLQNKFPLPSFRLAGNWPMTPLSHSMDAFNHGQKSMPTSAVSSSMKFVKPNLNILPASSASADNPSKTDQSHSTCKTGAIPKSWARDSKPNVGKPSAIVGGFKPVMKMSPATNNSPGHHSSASNCPSSGHSNPGLKCLPVYNTSSQHTQSPGNAATLYKQRLTEEENEHGEPNDVNENVQGSAGGQQQHEEHNSETGQNSSEDDDENSSHDDSDDGDDSLDNEDDSSDNEDDSSDDEDDSSDDEGDPSDHERWR